MLIPNGEFFLEFYHLDDLILSTAIYFVICKALFVIWNRNHNQSNVAYISFVFSFVGSYISVLSDVIIGSLQSFEVTVNVLVLWLILRANYNKYISLCKWCHICVAKCCFKRVDGNKIAQNPYSTLLIGNQSSFSQSNNPVSK